MREHRIKNGKPTRCTVCGEKLKSGKALGGHMTLHLKKTKTKKAKRVEKVLSGGRRIQTSFGMADVAPPLTSPNAFSGPSLLQGMLPDAVEAKRLKEENSSVVASLHAAATQKRKEANELDEMARRANQILL